MSLSAHAVTPQAVVDFWVSAGPQAWFAKDVAFDTRFRDLFADSYAAAASGALDDWAHTAEGLLALMILLDQFPRNSFRGSPQAFATDDKALALAKAGVAAGLDQQLPEDLRLFVYLPFEHAENLDEQAEALRLIAPLGPELMHYVQIHYDVIARFGRFPHRNDVLGRTSSAEERAFLESGGFAG